MSTRKTVYTNQYECGHEDQDVEFTPSEVPEFVEETHRMYSPCEYCKLSEYHNWMLEVCFGKPVYDKVKYTSYYHIVNNAKNRATINRIKEALENVTLHNNWR